jgi:hypothetical protein
LAEGPDGDLWVATKFGVYRAPHAEIDRRRQALSVFHLGQGAADTVRCLRFTRAGVLWAGTPYGLFYFAKDHFQQAVAGRTRHPASRLATLSQYDDGIGIDPKVLNEGARAEHWGLPGVRERAKLVGEAPIFGLFRKKIEVSWRVMDGKFGRQETIYILEEDQS